VILHARCKNEGNLARFLTVSYVHTKMNSLAVIEPATL